MHRNWTTQLLAIAVALAALTAGQASAALVVAAAGQESVDATVLHAELADLIPANDPGQQVSSFLSGFCGPLSPENETRAPHLHAQDYVPPSGMSPPASVTISGAAGVGTAAELNCISYTPDASPRGSLPREGAIVLPTGPPFELLRPA